MSFATKQSHCFRTAFAMPSYPQRPVTSHTAHRAQWDEAAPRGSSSSAQVLGLILHRTLTGSSALSSVVLPASPGEICPHTGQGGLAHRLPFPGSLGKPCRLPKNSLIPARHRGSPSPAWVADVDCLGVVDLSRVPGPAGNVLEKQDFGASEMALMEVQTLCWENLNLWSLKRTLQLPGSRTQYISGHIIPTVCGQESVPA